jgi:translation initiation factor IF-1
MIGDRIELEGTVLEMNKGVFKIQITDTHIITAKISGKLRINGINIICGDRVRVEVSPYDMCSGRIVYREKN